MHVFDSQPLHSSLEYAMDFLLFSQLLGFHIHIHMYVHTHLVLHMYISFLYIGLYIFRNGTTLIFISICDSFVFKSFSIHLFLTVRLFCLLLCVPRLCLVSSKVRKSHPLVLELWMALSHHVDAGN